MPEIEDYRDYLELRKLITEKGYLKSTPVYYIALFSFFVLSFGILIACIAFFNSWTVTALLAFPLGLIGMQFAFLGHEAGHRSISRSKFLNEFIGYFSVVFITGVSYRSWVERHNQHHATPNHEILDPDIKDASPFAYTEKNAVKRSGISKLITKNQAFILFPALLSLMFFKRSLYYKAILLNKYYLEYILQDYTDLLSQFKQETTPSELETQLKYIRLLNKL